MDAWRRRVMGAAALLFVVAVFIAPLPLYVIGPGSALPVEERVQLGRPPDAVSGDLLLLTVSLAQPSAARALYGWLDADQDVVAREDVVPEGVEDRDYLRAQRRLFRESGQVAAAVGLQAAGLPVRVTGGGARVAAVSPGTPAERALRPGDLIVAVDGRPVQLASDLSSTVAGRSSGDEITLGVRRGGTETPVRVRLEQLAELGRPGIGVALDTVNPDVSLPFPVEIDQGDIGGPSAGLMIALTVYELAHPGDLTAGRSIAGTGTIDITGRVGPVGGVRQKVLAARAADARMFLVPEDEAGEARRAAGDDLPVVPVRTFRDALERLEQRAA